MLATFVRSAPDGGPFECKIDLSPHSALRVFALAVGTRWGAFQTNAVQVRAVSLRIAETVMDVATVQQLWNKATLPKDQSFQWPKLMAHIKLTRDSRVANIYHQPAMSFERNLHCARVTSSLGMQQQCAHRLYLKVVET